MQDSLEDRIAAAGKHREFEEAYCDFIAGNKSKKAQQVFYDKLEQLGASSEEANEFVNMVMEE